MPEAVKVMVRCRPMNQKEKDRSNFMFMLFRLFFSCSSRFQK